MSGIRGARNRLAARRRLEFVLTTVLVVLLTGAGAALLIVPDPVRAPTRTVQPGLAGPAGTAAADPRLDEVRRIAEPYGPLVVREIRTGADRPALVVGHPTQQHDIDVLAGELAAATASITELWGPEWSRSPVVVVSATRPEFTALVRAPGALPSEVAAVTIADPFAPGTQPTGQRVVFGPDAGRRLDPAGLRTLLRHELTHVATRAVTVDGAPQWLLEGFAEYAAHRATSRPFSEIAPTVYRDIRGGAMAPDFPTDPMFTGDRAAAAYELAWSICAYLAHRYGETNLVALYHRLATGPHTPQTEHAAFRDVLGTDRQAVLNGWRTWLSDRSR